ncbi:3-oxoacyl-[acyl-carrier-protein] synthase III C-terminal domain-containing protein, partial [Streptomyces sp. YS-3]|uniref:3-oxoacyl-[acyl-carrier-protein] synthase III C-terminal domain-containing protein n=1 Tax=Streptomyces sp. YS-3 TaxID=3381352 RepID=UPI003862920C
PHQLYLRMSGAPVYAHAVHRMTQSSRTVLARAGWPANSIEVFIGHQANQRILDAVADRLNIAPLHRHGNIREVANTAAASIPLAMYSAAQLNVLRSGARTLLTAFGGGLTWGSITLTWPDLTPHALPPQPHSTHNALPPKTPDLAAVYDTLLTLLTEKFGVPAQQVTPGMSLADLELDSLAVAEFFLTVQERFNRSLDEDQWQAERTLQDIASTVKALR